MNNTGVFLESLNSIRFYLNQQEKRYAIILFFLLLISSVLDVFGLASLIPVIMVASNPGSVYENKYFFAVYEFLGFGNERNFIVFLISAIFVFFAVKNLFIIWINNKQNLFSVNLVLKIIERQFRKYINLPFLEFYKWGSGFIINSTINIPGAYVIGIVRPMFIILSEVTIIAVILLGIIFYNPVLFLILLVVLVPSTFFTYKVLKNKSQVIGNKLNDLKPIAHKIITEAFNGYIELKLANKQEDYKNKFLDTQRYGQKLEASAYLFTLIPIRIIEMVAILGVVTIFFYSLFFSNNSGELLTIIGLFAAAAYRLMPSINRLLTSLVLLKQYNYTIKDMERHQEYIKNSYVAQEPGPLEFKEAIEFRNIKFTFPDNTVPTLKDINLKITKGERLGLIGSSGSGKTTIINILLRFITEDEGQVLVDGVPLNPQNLKAWHQKIGYVKQDTFLMEDSIKNNITLGDSLVNQERLEYAIEKASLKEFISGLPKGLETQIGERGSKLSGGQRQRLGIARALYKETQVLVFDEATSALDTETEREVSEAINKLTQTDITIIIIAHRITTLKECTRILELKNGEIIAEHNYQELIRQVI